MKNTIRRPEGMPHLMTLCENLILRESERCSATEIISFDLAMWDIIPQFCSVANLMEGFCYTL